MNFAQNHSICEIHASIKKATFLAESRFFCHFAIYSRSYIYTIRPRAKILSISAIPKNLYERLT